MPTNTYAIAIHGGAGALRPEKYSKSDIEQHFASLRESLTAGFSLLEKGEDAMSACVSAVSVLEDCELFNAGKGSVLGADGKVAMDASVMCGKNQESGAVSLVTEVKNPIKAALKVMRDCPHVCLGRAKADEFAGKCGLDVCDQAYFITDYRAQQLERALAKGIITLDHTPEDEGGTVGAVALDQAGNLAAATSTGGMTGKFPGRVSDSSIIGAGTYAKNSTCAISSTGRGDYFIRKVLAYDVSCRMEYLGQKLDGASKESLQQLQAIGGEGGLIGIDSNCNIVLPYNTHGMWRGWKKSDGSCETKVFETT